MDERVARNSRIWVVGLGMVGRWLLEQVVCRGITEIGGAMVDEARASGARLRHLATLEFTGPDGAGDAAARVEPALLPAGDPLAAVDGTANAVECQVSPVGAVTIIGPGAGPRLAGQGVFSDLVAVLRGHR